MNLLIFDDHSIITDSLSMKLDSMHLFEKIILTNTKEEVFNILNKESIQFIISDVLTDEEIGLSLFERYQSLNIPIIAFTSVGSKIVLDSLKALGVDRCINKKEPIDVLISQVKELLEVENNKNITKIISLPILSPKEKQIVEMISRGMLSKEIAAATNSSVNTVNNQKNTLLEKFNVSNSTELISYLIKSGYIQI